jgi:hypothetical protein
VSRKIEKKRAPGDVDLLLVVEEDRDIADQIVLGEGDPPERGLASSRIRPARAVTQTSSTSVDAASSMAAAANRLRPQASG